jgi:N utilization substance protein A
MVRWNDDPEQLIANLLQPVQIERVILSPAGKRATVVVPEDQLSLAHGRRDANRGLASRASGWEIEIVAWPADDL